MSLGEDGAVNLDRTARQIAGDYRSRCYEPVRKREVPDDICQFQLFDRAERQWGSEYSVKELNETANRILGDEIETAIQKLLVFDLPSQRYVSGNVRSRFELIEGLKDKYKLR